MRPCRVRPVFPFSHRLQNMRTLIVIPIVHTEQDMGSLHGQTKLDYVKKFGQAKWIRHLQSIDDVWTGIRKIIQALHLPYASVRLYQDGLPICGKEEQIVQDVAAQGSKNYQLLVEFIGLGSRLMGTEDPQLLLQEYRFHQEAGRDADAEHSAQRVRQSRQLLIERDRFIANRINATLLADEVGLLFLGLAHSVESLLDADILVRQLLPSLREKQVLSAS